MVMTGPMRLLRKVWMAVGALTLLALAGCGADRSPAPAREAEAAAAPRPVHLTQNIADFYAARGHRPLWVANGALRPEAIELAGRMARYSRTDGELAKAVTAARDGDKRALARADLLLSRDYVELAQMLRRPPGSNRMAYVEPGLAPVPAPGGRELLEAAAAAPSLGAHLGEAVAVNPLHASLASGFAKWRARWATLPDLAIPAGPTLGLGDKGPRVALLRRRLGLAKGTSFDAALAARVGEYRAAHGLPASTSADEATIKSLNGGAAPYEAKILANLERARAVPALPGRYVLVDAGSARLWMIENGRSVGSMKVVVGKPAMATPVMAGRIRFATLNPYWNLPPDLARDRARRVLRDGTDFLRRQRIEALSDWSGSARLVPLSSVDWRSAAAGRISLRLRQLPGGSNAMGAVKFMFPNDLGIYLHDTPERNLFARADRHLSSGCVRLEDAPRLAAWLFRGAPPRALNARPEQDVDLPQPVPVYLVYLTVIPTRDGLGLLPDPYRRDRVAMARIGRDAGRVRAA